jgi:hypothetical protein
MGRLRQSRAKDEMAARRNYALVADDTRRELDLLWEQGVKAVREDVKEVKGEIKDINEKVDKVQTSMRAEIKGLAESISSFRRWIVALILTLIPAYIAVAVSLLRK